MEVDFLFYWFVYGGLEMGETSREKRGEREKQGA